MSTEPSIARHRPYVGLIVDSTGLKIAGAAGLHQDSHECLTITTLSKGLSTGHINATLDLRVQTNIPFDPDAEKDSNDVFLTTRTLVVGSADGFRNSVPYNDVLAMLKFLPNLATLKIRYDISRSSATATTQKNRPKDFRHLKLSSYELTCIFPNCELPILASRTTLRELTVTPGALQRMTDTEISRFLSAFRKVLPNLRVLKLNFHWLMTHESREDDPMQRFSTPAAVELLYKIQLQLRLRELHIEDEAGLHQGDLLHRLFEFIARTPELRMLTVSVRLGPLDSGGCESFPDYMWRRDDVQNLVYCLDRLQPFADTPSRKGLRLRCVKIFIKGHRIERDLKLHFSLMCFKRWSETNRVKGVFAILSA